MIIGTPVKQDSTQTEQDFYHNNIVDGALYRQKRYNSILLMYCRILKNKILKHTFKLLCNIVLLHRII